MKDIRGDLGTVLKTGKVSIGTKNVISALLTGGPKLVIVSGNCPGELKEKVVYYSQLSNTPHHITAENSMELGSICGKPFPASVIAVMDEGGSDIVAKYKEK